MMTTLPLSVSAILPVYNGEAFLAEAIESVLRQAYEPLEVIVIDDGSTDRTAEIARGYGEKVRYLRQDNTGAAAARNNGLRLASGDVIAFIDADDLWPETKLVLQMERFQQDPTLEVVVGRVQYFVPRQTSDGKVEFAPFMPPILGGNLGAGVYKRAVFEKLGYLDERYWYCDDVDLFMRIREQHIPMIVIDAVTLNYRIHNTNMTRERPARDSDFHRALKRSLDRRRLLAGNEQPGSLPAMKKESEERP
jgi:glycosyltransferase involved in cell wall biosynthesis